MLLVLNMFSYDVFKTCLYTNVSKLMLCYMSETCFIYSVNG